MTEEAALHKRLYRRGMGDHRALLARTTKVGRPRLHRHGICGTRSSTLGRDGLPVGATARDFRLTTVQYHFYRMRDSGYSMRSTRCGAEVRVAEGREATNRPQDHRQPVGENTEAGGPRGYDAGKKVKGRKRHIATDTTATCSTDWFGRRYQDRDGAPNSSSAVATPIPRLTVSRRWRLCRAETGRCHRAYRPPCHRDRPAFRTPTLRRLARRWVVERTIAWLNRCGRSPKTGRHPSPPQKHGLSSPPSGG